jgi:hypothetical protein
VFGNAYSFVARTSREDFISVTWGAWCGVHSPKGANFDSRFVSREGAKNAKEKACDGFSVSSLEKVSSATEFRPLRVLRVRNIFAPFGECTRGVGEWLPGLTHHDF